VFESSPKASRDVRKNAKQEKLYSTENLVNFAWFQVLWFLGVLTAPSNETAAVPVLIAVLVGGYLYYIRQDLNIIFVSRVAMVTAVGIALETMWISLGFINYIHSDMTYNLPPFWLSCLWLSVALSLAYSLAWLKRNLIMAAAFSLLSCPLSYYAAQRLGALDITLSFPAFMLTIALSWAILIPLSLALIHANDRGASWL